MRNKDCAECGRQFYGYKDEERCPRCEFDLLLDFMTGMGYDINGVPLDQRREDGVVTENAKVGRVKVTP